MVTAQEIGARITCRLRMNSRISLEGLSQGSGANAARVSALLQDPARLGIIRYVSLIEPSIIGYSLAVLLLVKTETISDMLADKDLSKNVNNLRRLSVRELFIAECVFPDMSCLDRFRNGLRSRSCRILFEAFITEDIKREGFMAGQNG